MINALRAYELMPSVQRNKCLREKRLEEISNLIEQTARNDGDFIIIYLYSFEHNYIIENLTARRFKVECLPETMQQNGDISRTKYKISWC